MDFTKRHTDADESLFKGPYIEIESKEQFMELAEAVRDTHLSFQDQVKYMTKEEAQFIRHWRCGDNGGTWRWVAERAYEAKICGGDWSPPSNQLMGMALSECAAQIFGENYMEPPWN